MGFLAGETLTAAKLNAAVPGLEQGEWTIAADLAIGTPTLINNWTPYPGATVDGITVVAGVFTVGIGGEYNIGLATRFSATAAGGHYCFIAGAGANPIWTKSSEAGTVNTSCSITKRIPAGGTFRCYAYSSPGSNVTKENGADLVTGVTAYRLGN